MVKFVGEDTTQTITNKTIDGDDNTILDAAPAVHSHAESDVTNLAADLAAKADLVSGKVPTSQIPAQALTTVQIAASQAAMLALTTQAGDVVVRTDENKTYMHNGGAAGTMADFTLLNTPADAVTSVNGQTGTIVLAASDVGAVPTTRTVNGYALSSNVTLAKGDVGLGNADNTADASKPVSTAQQAAIDAKVDDTAYGAGWDGDTTHAPSKNALYDKLSTMGSGGQTTVTRIVAASGGDHTTLQAALSAASAGDTILVRNGTYALTANVTIANTKPNLSIVGENSTKALINLAGFTLTFQGVEVDIRNIGFTDNTNTSYVRLEGARSSYTNCYFNTSKTTATFVYLGAGSGSERMRMSDCHINTTGATTNYILACGSKDAIISNNRFTCAADGNSFAVNATCIYITQPNVMVSNNSFYIATCNNITQPVVGNSTAATGMVATGNILDVSTNAVFFWVEGATSIIMGNRAVAGYAGVDNRASGTVIAANSFSVSVATGAGIYNGGGTSNHSAVHGNYVTGGAHGVKVRNNDSYWAISGNAFTGNDRGIQVLGTGSNKTVISGNDLVGNTTAALTDGGTGTITDGSNSS